MRNKGYAPFTERVIEIIKNIPKGQVMTYGEVARMAGHPNAARQVARILHSLSEKEDLPWHRVIGKNGISLKGPEGDRQRELIECENQTFSPTIP